MNKKAAVEAVRSILRHQTADHWLACACVECEDKRVAILDEYARAVAIEAYCEAAGKWCLEYPKEFQQDAEEWWNERN